MKTQLRKAANSSFAENFSKFIANFAFGNTMESKEKRKKLSIVREETETMQKFCRSSLSFLQIIDEEVANVTFNPSSTH